MSDSNKSLVLNILNYYQSGVRNIGVFLSLSLVLFSFSLYFRNMNMYLLITIHLVSLFLIILVGIIAHFLHQDSIRFKLDDDISANYYQLYLIKWLHLIYSLKIITLILCLVFILIIAFDIKNYFFLKKKYKVN